MTVAISCARMLEDKINEETSRTKRLADQVLKECTAKGLCWYCDEKWNCKQKRLLMIEPVKNYDNISSSSEFTEVEETKETNFNRDQFSISYYALSRKLIIHGRMQHTCEMNTVS